MNPLTHFKKILILPLLMTLALAAFASAKVARADVVIDWNAIASTVIDARVWSGIHFRTADTQGAALGNKVAHYSTSTTSSRCDDTERRGAVLSAPRRGGSALTRSLGITKN